MIHASTDPSLHKFISTVKGETEVVVTEGAVVIEVLVGRYSDFKFVFSSTVGHYFPVINAASETSVSEDTSEHIRLFLEETMLIALTKIDTSTSFGRVPGQ